MRQPFQETVPLLFDENLPRSLVFKLGHLFPGAKHVADLGMLSATDMEIWNYCKAFNMAIVTKDSDFAEKVKTLGPPPSVIHLQIGNCPVWRLVAAMEASAKNIKTHLQSGDGLFELNNLG